MIHFFNIHIDNAIMKWKEKAPAGILTNQKKNMSIPLYADNVVLMENSDNELQNQIF